MAQGESDRNLLFGILALQMDFIARDDLVAAMSAWVVQKHRPLADILQERGALSPGDHALLEPLVHRHIEQHGGNPARSLAALSSAGGLRNDLASVAHTDPDVQASLAVLEPSGSRDAWPATRPPSEVSATASIGVPSAAGQRFRILRPHARGGLGEVYVARDQELNREVALKQIQDRHADRADSRSRFLLEAEITGGLEHPGIVPVYGLGHYPDGRPFYAMRFIRGDSLEEAITRFHRADQQPGRDQGERAMALRQLLGRFVDVCNAVAYAHSRGVLHRDLKPGNVMLGPFGETLVVDWGLAKTIGRPEDAERTTERTLRPSSGSGRTPTQMGSAIGTPAYMSPEQATGRLDELGPASDVYSLGAMLYSLLVGRVPFPDSELGVVLSKVRAGDFPPPRQVERTVPPALEAVCLKAMAREPGARYASPKGLADDIEHWLADRPVSAWIEPWSVRLRRWLGQHRTLVAASLAVLLTAVVGLGISAVFLSWEKNRTELAHTEAVINAGKARRQAELARASELQARKHQERAERRLAVMREAVDRFWLTRLSESAATSASALVANDDAQFLNNLLDGSLTFYNGLLDDKLGDAFTPTDKARFLTCIGIVHHFYMQAGKNLGPLVAMWDKEVHVLQAIAAFNKAMSLAPTYAPARFWLGTTLKDSGRYDQSISVFRKLIEMEPKSAPAHVSLALALGLKGQPGEAVPILQKAVELDSKNVGAFEILAQALQATRRFDEAIPVLHKVIELAPLNPGAHDSLGWTLNQKGRYDEAIPILRTAIEQDAMSVPARINLSWALCQKGQFGETIPILRTAIELDAANVIAHTYLGWALVEKGQFDEGIVVLTRAVELDPRNVLALANLGRALGDKARYDEALSVLQKAVELDPGNAAAHNFLGWVLIGKGQYDEAISELRRAIELDPRRSNVHGNLGRAFIEKRRFDDAINELRKAIELNPKDAASYRNLGWALLQKGRHDEAETVLRKAVEADPTDVTARDNLGIALHQAGRIDEAIDLYREVVALQPRFGLGQSNLGWALFQKGRFDEAIPVLRKAIELDESNANAQQQLAYALEIKGLYEQALPHRRKDVELEPKASASYISLGWNLNQLGRFDEAISVLSKAVELDPDRAVACENLGRALNGKGRFDEAVPVLRKAIELDPKDDLARGYLTVALGTLGRHSEAEPLLRDMLARRRATERPGSAGLSDDLAQLGTNLLLQSKWAAAETNLRECLTIRETSAPDEWARFQTMNQLGGALLGQGRYAAAEPLIVGGYEGMNSREAAIPPTERPRLSEAAARVVRLYQAWGKPDKATEWNRTLGLADLPADVFAAP